MTDFTASPSEKLAITRLIEARCAALGLGRGELARRTGYRNPAKALQRLDALLAGDFAKSRDLLRSLPAALGVSPEEVAAALDSSRRQIAAAEAAEQQARDAAWRATFTPHAVILTAETFPRPFFMAAIVGVERLLRIDFATHSAPVTYVRQALDRLWRHRPQPPGVMCFGAATGFVVNYTPDRAIRFDLDGNPLEALPRACRPGEAQLLLGGRPLAAEAMRALFANGDALTPPSPPSPSRPVA